MTYFHTHSQNYIPRVSLMVPNLSIFYSIYLLGADPELGAHLPVHGDDGQVCSDG